MIKTTSCPFQDRTPQEFVEDMISNCRSLDQIFIVVANTMWKNRKDEIVEAYHELMENRKRISNRNREDR